jgi:hypothetical protein
VSTEAAAGVCGSCGSTLTAEAVFCSQCGAPVAAWAPPREPVGAAPPVPPPMFGYAEAGSSPAPPGMPPLDEPYPPSAVLVAVVATLTVPFISLIAALVMRSDETSPRRRSQLAQWAAASGAVMVVGVVLVLSVLGTFASSVGGGGGGACKGPIDRLTPPSYVSTSDGEWQKVLSCVGGGTKVVDVPPGRFPNN